MKRCGWHGDDPFYIRYHDEEWGVPEWEGRSLWEKLVLDGFQAGLSWITILRKRDNFREAFQGFNPEIVATWDEADVLRLLTNEGIIRHRGKIEATITNARAYLEIEAKEGFSEYCWSFVGGTPLINRFDCLDAVPPQTLISQKFSKDLKKRGFKYCGPTIVYAWMEACGLVNDHLTTCFRHEEVKTL